jgi:hypothetical protein
MKNTFKHDAIRGSLKDFLFSTPDLDTESFAFLYSTWRDFYKLYAKESSWNWEEDFETLDDGISYHIYQDILWLNSNETDSVSIERLAIILKNDHQMFDYCKRQVVGNGIFFILKGKHRIADTKYIEQAIQIVETL